MNNFDKGHSPVELNIVRGSLYALVGFFFMAVFGILTKEALESGSAIWVSFYAYVAGVTPLCFYVFYKGFEYLKSEHYPYLIGRAVFGCLASFLYTISINYIPIVNSTLLFNTAPIFIPILSILFLKAHIKKSIWLAIAIGFIGIIFIIRPTGAIFTQVGNLIALASGISLAVAYLLMKLLTASDPGIRIIFYYLGIGALVQIPLILFAGAQPDIRSVIFSGISGIMLLISQLALVNAYRYALASQVGVYQYCSVVFVGLLQWWIWGAVPNVWDFIGVLLVTIAGVMIIKKSKST